MDYTTFFVYVGMYIYGFTLIIWAIFFDKSPTKRSLIGAKIGLAALILTLFYFFYVLFTIGLR